MKIVSYNIQHSLGKDGTHDIRRLVDAVQNADVIALQEVTRHMASVPDFDQPARIAELLPEYFWVYGPPVDMAASLQGEKTAHDNRRLQFGNMLLAKWPILSSRLILLPRTRTYDKYNFQCGALEGIVDAPGGALRFYGVHLNRLSSEERMMQLDFLLPKMLEVLMDGATVTGGSWHTIPDISLPDDYVMLGDYNLPPNSAEYTRIVGEVDYFYGSRVTARHLVDTWVRSGNARDDGVTWYDGGNDWKPGTRIDYVFVSPGLADKVKSAWIDDDAPGSDHQPVWAELDY